MADRPNCGNCRFSRQKKASKSQQLYGHASTIWHCHRHPPVVVPDEGHPDTFWPIVYHYEWCGHWEGDGTNPADPTSNGYG